MAEGEAQVEDYASMWDEFKLRTDEKEKTIEFLKTLKTCNFVEITSMISIGAGEAEVDFEVIKCSCPKLKKYIAVEPRGESIEIIKNKFKELPHVQVDTVQKTMEDYGGPDEPVDLVFICNSSYYFRDGYHKQMSRALGWLSRDGYLIDIRDNIEDIPYRQKLKSMGSKPGTSMKTAQKDFLNWCLENGWDVDGSVDEKEYTIDYSIDISEPGLDQVLKLLVHTLPEDEMEKAKEAVSESVIKGTTRVPGKQLVIIISRAKETDGDQTEDAAVTKQDGERVAVATDENNSTVNDENDTAEKSAKVPRLSDDEQQQQQQQQQNNK